jgi:uncharacterized protein YhaN
MRIERLKVQGFGQLEALELRFSSGLNLVFAPNEAGKSTLLAFVRSILFGFSRRGELAGYEPERGRMGGELLLSTGAGPLHVRRMGAKGRPEGELSLKGAEGELLPEARLSEALSGISRELFFQVFAFGLDELASFEKLAAEGSVSEALLAAGTRGAKRLPTALEVLRKSSEAIYGVKASRRELNRIFQELDATSQALRAIGNRPAQYLKLCETSDRLEIELHAVDEESEEMGGEIRLLEKLSRAASDLKELGSLRSLLTDDESLAQFPAEGEARLEELSSKLGRARAEAEEGRAQIAQFERELAKINIPQALSDTEGELARAVREFSGRLEQLRSLRKRAAAIEQARREAEEALGSMGLQISPEQLLGLQLDVEGREDLAELRLRSEQSREAAVRAEERARSAASEAERFAAAVPEELLVAPPREAGLWRWTWAALIGLVVVSATLYLARGGEQGWAVASAAVLAAVLLFILGREAVRRQRHAEETHRLRDARLAQQRHSSASFRARAVEECQRAFAEQRSAEAELKSFLLSTGLPAHLGAESAVEAWAQLAALQQRFQALSEQSTALAVDVSACQDAAEAVVRQARRLSLSFVTPEEAAAALGSALEQMREAKENRQRLEQALALTSEQASRLARDRDELEAALAQLLEQGGCRTESEFRSRAARAAGFRAALLKRSELALRIGTVTGTSVEEAQLELERRGGAPAIAGALTGHLQQRQQLERRRRELFDQLGNARGQIRIWEEDRSLFQLRSRQEALRRKAQELADQYAINRLALGLLVQARRAFEREQQPRIVRLASRIFRELTEGRYLRLYTKPGSPRGLFAGSSSGQEWPAERLSRGTREQLFLAFRLGVAEEFADSQEPLPLILDDVLVNFDAARARNAVHALGRISRRQQVIAFSCHLHLREVFASSGAQIAELPSLQAALWAESA